ncbi:hypothetical protein [Microbulbifer aggregans]|uniref:hypothetical protein n=1 Tax=Microbulbifer aggregans TaxID=1769779 RepID=UPI001CFE4727|nr:hypothetical protein [Microbulbifer aggregans]
MSIPALAIALTCTNIFYFGLAIARLARRKLFRIIIRIGAVIATILSIGLVPYFMSESLVTTEKAGYYLFYLLIFGALIYKIFLTRIIPLASEK